MKLLAVKSWLIAFLGLLALCLAITGKDALFLSGVAVALISALIFDSLFIYLKEKKVRVTDSSIITGLIIGYVLASDEPFWKFIAAALLAIGSKHIIRVNKKHLFNPAAFGVFLTMFLFGANTQWRGAYLWYVLIPVGLFFAYKVQKKEVLAGYLFSALGLFAAQALLQKAPLLNIFGFLSYFYIFVMVIEPKTTPVFKRAKFAFGLGVGILVFLFTELGVNFDAELAALLLMNLSVPLLNKIPQRRGA
ncbi:MAG: RnfABCDGE type electron transport complex subunit D [Candidatus Omnitrophica bacterium]|nr:RnfABCDGE type electron transport complex subunit D [Candidatus Omnitrophota bacterium]